MPWAAGPATAASRTAGSTRVPSICHARGQRGAGRQAPPRRAGAATCLRRGRAARAPGAPRRAVGGGRPGRLRSGSRAGRPPRGGGLLGAARVAAARSAGRRIGSVILTVPDNPTGRLARPGTVRTLCDVAAENDLTIICDEIYRDLVHDPAADVRSPSA
jgi:hypothetical protein